MRPTLNMKDMVRFYETLLEAPKQKIHRQAFNIAYNNMTIMEIAKLVKKILNDDSIDIEITPTDDLRSYHVSTEKIKKVLGFECKFGIDDGIKSIADAFHKGLIKDGLNNPLYYNIKRMKEIQLK